MGEAKRNRGRPLLFRDIREGKFPCVYCGGSVPGVEPEHMPPRVLFDGRKRPNEMVFPSCKPCNHGSKDLDQIAAFMSRVYPRKDTVVGREETQRLFSVVRTNYPEIYTSIVATHTPLELRQHGQTLELKGPYVRTAMRLFGAKLGFALHWHLTKSIVPTDGGAMVYWITNGAMFRGQVPPGILSLFDQFETLRQGQLEVSDQFTYSSVRDTEHQGVSAHLGVFRASFMIFAIVSEKRGILEPFSDGDLYRPGCLQITYPFGLPRLSPIELSFRLKKMHRAVRLYSHDE